MKDLLGCSDLLDLCMVHHDYTVCNFEGFLLIMGHQNRCRVHLLVKPS